jgi:hypothetical protein
MKTLPRNQRVSLDAHFAGIIDWVLSPGGDAIPALGRESGPFHTNYRYVK